MHSRVMLLQSIKRIDQFKKYSEGTFKSEFLLTIKEISKPIKDSFGKIFSIIPLYKMINLSSLMTPFSNPRVVNVI